MASLLGVSGKRVGIMDKSCLNDVIDRLVGIRDSVEFAGQGLDVLVEARGQDERGNFICNFMELEGIDVFEDCVYFICNEDGDGDV